jgi:hypothetical protein
VVTSPNSCYDALFDSTLSFGVVVSELFNDSEVVIRTLLDWSKLLESIQLSYGVLHLKAKTKMSFYIIKFEILIFIIMYALDMS